MTEAIEEIESVAENAPAELSDTRRACLKKAATLLGASEDAAQQFAEHGATIVEEFPLHVMHMGPGDGPWVACMKVERPAGVGEPAWAEALLVANGTSMMVHDWAFGLEDDLSGVLLLQLPEDLVDARLLAGSLEGMLTMCRSVVVGALTLRSMAASAELAS